MKANILKAVAVVIGLCFSVTFVYASDSVSRIPGVNAKIAIERKNIERGPVYSGPMDIRDGSLDNSISKMSIIAEKSIMWSRGDSVPVGVDMIKIAQKSFYPRGRVSNIITYILRVLRYHPSTGYIAESRVESYYNGRLKHQRCTEYDERGGVVEQVHREYDRRTGELIRETTTTDTDSETEGEIVYDDGLADAIPEESLIPDYSDPFRDSSFPARYPHGTFLRAGSLNSVVPDCLLLGTLDIESPTESSHIYITGTIKGLNDSGEPVVPVVRGGRFSTKVTAVVSDMVMY